MANRDELKALIDQMPDERLELVGLNLESILHPPTRNPQMEKMIRRTEEFHQQLPERLKILQAGNSPETPHGFYGFGSGSGGSYSWQENRAHVTHKMHLYEGHEIDFVDRVELSDDGKTLIYEQEVYAEGRSVTRREEFPVMNQNRD